MTRFMISAPQPEAVEAGCGAEIIQRVIILSFTNCLPNPLPT